MSYTWSSGTPSVVERRLPADRPTWFISDLHLGDGKHSDIFMGKDRALLALLDEVREKKGRLVILGDAIDFLQAGDFTPIVKAHGSLLRAFSDLASVTDVVYVVGNHDHDLHVYRDLLRFDVCHRLWIGDDVAVMHGHQFDPWIGPSVVASNVITRLHHLIERWFRVWIRLPLSDFYNWGNRLTFWLFHKYWLLLSGRNVLLRKVGLDGIARRSEFMIDYWVRNEAGDPMTMFRPALAWAKLEKARAVVCGHSHMPANLELEGVRFVNTGSWTFGWAQYAVLADGAFLVRDWLSGRVYQEELYRPLLDGELDHLDFGRWWRNQYLGWFRFRSGELRKRPTLERVTTPGR